MRTTFLSALLCLCVHSLPFRLQATDYIWDNQGANGVWNNPINWGTLNNSGFNTEPTPADGAIFRKNFSPAGTVTLTFNGFAQRIRQEFARDKRVITIGASETQDWTLTLSGTASGVIDGSNAGVDFSIDGTRNAQGARLKLRLDGSGTGTGTSLNKAVTLTISCDVSGAGGFTLNGGEDGPGRLWLAGNNTYTGPTVINSGVLLVNGTNAPGSAVTVNSGGILGGTGTIGGAVTVSPGGLISPGVSSQAPLIGTLTLTSNLTLAGDVQIEVNKSLSPSNDFVKVNGILTNTGVGAIQVYNYGSVFAAGDRFQIFSKPVQNGQALKIFSAGREVWTNKLAVDGSIAVLSATNTPITGNPTKVYTWKGAVTTDQPWKAPMLAPANWVENQAPAPLSSNVFVFQGDILVPYNWPYVDTNYGTSILIFSNNTVLNSIKILGGSNHFMNLGSYVRQDTPQPCYYGITGEVPIVVGGVTYHSTNAFFTNALGDASCGSQTEFQCTGGRLDVYSVLIDGAGTSSRLVKSGNYTLNLTGDYLLGNDANTYTGGTIVNAGVIKLAKLPGVNCIPGDVTVNGTGSLGMNIAGGEQIADTAIVTLNDSGSLGLAGQPETVGTVQGASAKASVNLGTGGTLTVAPSAALTYNGGLGESYFNGSITGSGTVRMNGTGTCGLLGANAVNAITVNSGVLKLNGNSGTGAVTVNAGGTLLGKGTIAGPVTVAAGGTLGAGLSVGSLTLPAGLNMSTAGAGATNVWELAALVDSSTGFAGTDFNQVILTGGTLALGLQATLDIRFVGAATAPDPGNPFWQEPHTWKIIALNGGSNPGGSNFGRITYSPSRAGSFSTSVDLNNGSILLNFTPFTTVVCWGDNTLGQLDGFPRVTNMIAVAAGSWHNLALQPDGQVLAWGNDDDGQCDVPQSLNDALAIAAGGYHSLAIHANGTVAAWGNNDYGQCALPIGLARVIGIGAGLWHSLALRADGTVVAWGDNSFGQCNVPPGLNGVVAVAAGGNHSLALLGNGKVVGWGENTDVNGVFAGQATPPAGLSNVVALAAGSYHSLAVLRDGSVAAWGDNSSGQCQKPAGLTNAVAVAGGGTHSLALCRDGTVVAWGANWSGQSTVSPAFQGPGADAVAVGAGEYHSLALIGGCLPVPRMLNAAKQGATFSALVQSLYRKTYALEFKPALTVTNWTVASTNSGNGALRVLSDPSAVGTERYYRTHQW